MEEIKKDALHEIKGGGAITIWTGIAISALIVFLSGVIEGITNPKECNG